MKRAGSSVSSETNLPQNALFSGCHTPLIITVNQSRPEAASSLSMRLRSSPRIDAQSDESRASP
jgi:hypothetical protein